MTLDELATLPCTCPKCIYIHTSPIIAISRLRLNPEIVYTRTYITMIAHRHTLPSSYSLTSNTYPFILH